MGVQEGNLLGELGVGEKHLVVATSELGGKDGGRMVEGGVMKG